MTDFVTNSNAARVLNTSMDDSCETMRHEKKLSKPGLPQGVVELLLDKLANDDLYRALFQRNPVAALEQVGVPDALNSSECIHASKLPSKEVIQQARGALLLQLTSKLSHAIFKIG